MSTESEQSKSASGLARYQAELGNELSDIALPGIQDVINSITRQLGKGGIPSDVSSIFDAARAQTNQSFDSSLKANTAMQRQQALQSGQVFSMGQVDSSISQAAEGMEQGRQQALRNLKYQETAAGMEQFNTLMSMLGQSSGAAMNLGKGFSANQAAAISGMSTSSQFGNTLGGASSGAALGTSIYPGWGTAIGAVAGGAAGYFGS